MLHATHATLHGPWWRDGLACDDRARHSRRRRHDTRDPRDRARHSRTSSRSRATLANFVVIARDTRELRRDTRDIRDRARHSRKSSRLSRSSQSRATLANFVVILAITRDTRESRVPTTARDIRELRRSEAMSAPSS